MEEGCRVGVIGGGPAGSLFAYFLLTFADRIDLNLSVDIYEPRDFRQPGPGSCNMCGGIVSELLVQALAAEGINLPSSVVQRGIDSYVLHTDEASVRIDTPLHEKRIAAVHRGGGPRDVEDIKYGGIDGYLLGLAQELGARVVPTRVPELGWDDGRPQVRLKDQSQTYDLLAGATGVNSSAWQLYEKLGFQGKAPKTSKTFITEIKMGPQRVSEYFGSSMHVFFMDMPHVEFAAIIPKGDYATVCLLGDDIDHEVIDDFFARPVVQRCFPTDWEPHQGACHCAPRINIKQAQRPYLDRVVLIGDSGVTRLYKDGIGAAYRTAKAAAITAVFDGIAAENFRRHYWATYRSLGRDNRYGFVVFAVAHLIKVMKPMVRGVVRMTSREQSKAGSAKRMSTVLWDMFTGSAPYRDVFFMSLDPRFLMRLFWESAGSLVRKSATEVHVERAGKQPG